MRDDLFVAAAAEMSMNRAAAGPAILADLAELRDGQLYRQLTLRQLNQLYQHLAPLAKYPELRELAGRLQYAVSSEAWRIGSALSPDVYTDEAWDRRENDRFFDPFTGPYGTWMRRDSSSVPNRAGQTAGVRPPDEVQRQIRAQNIWTTGDAALLGHLEATAEADGPKPGDLAERIEGLRAKRERSAEVYGTTDAGEDT